MSRNFQGLLSRLASRPDWPVALRPGCSYEGEGGIRNREVVNDLGTEVCVEADGREADWEECR